jgi:hypothetical protein
VLGYIPQATGCAVLLFTLTGQRLRSKSFLFTTGIFSAIAMAVRLICNYGLIEFGFHTILIWIIFVIVAILYNKFPVMQSTVSILFSGIIIALAEVIVGVIFTLTIGAEEFNAIMDNTSTIQGQIARAMCGIPVNILFVAFVLVIHLIIVRRRAKLALKKENAEAEDSTSV